MISLFKFVLGKNISKAPKLILRTLDIILLIHKFV